MYFTQLAVDFFACITLLFKNLADATKINVNKRHLGLPNIQELQDFAETYFQENIILIKELLSKNIKKKYSIEYIINFLNQHHCQHIEIMKIIINLHNLKFNKNFNESIFQVLLANH